MINYCILKIILFKVYLILLQLFDKMSSTNYCTCMYIYYIILCTIKFHQIHSSFMKIVCFVNSSLNGYEKKCLTTFYGISKT